jgi:hypothetical protein
MNMDFLEVMTHVSQMFRTVLEGQSFESQMRTHPSAGPPPASNAGFLAASIGVERDGAERMVSRKWRCSICGGWTAPRILALLSLWGTDGATNLGAAQFVGDGRRHESWRCTTMAPLAWRFLSGAAGCGAVWGERRREARMGWGGQSGVKDVRKRKWDGMDSLNFDPLNHKTWKGGQVSGKARR